MVRLTEQVIANLGSSGDLSQSATMTPSERVHPTNSPDTEQTNPSSHQLSTASAKKTPLAHKQSTPLPQAPFSNITNAMNFGDDGLYEVIGL